MSATVLSYICQRFANDEEPYTALELEEKTGIPIRVTMAILDRLKTIELITETICLQLTELHTLLRTTLTTLAWANWWTVWEQNLHKTPNLTTICLNMHGKKMRTKRWKLFTKTILTL